MSNRPVNSSADGLFFRSGIKKNKVKNSAPVKDFTLGSIDSSVKSLSGSFRFDSAGSALKSTQQLNIDFSDFAQHTFFNSALAKTQKAFDRIINSYPFDGSKSEVQSFVDSLTGYEKYVWDGTQVTLQYLCLPTSACKKCNQYQQALYP